MAFIKKKKPVEQEEDDFEEEFEEEPIPVKKKVNPVKDVQAGWVAQDYPIQHQRVIYNEKTKEVFDEASALAWIMNKLED